MRLTAIAFFLSSILFVMSCSSTNPVSFTGDLPSGAIVTFTDSAAHPGYTYTGNYGFGGDGNWSIGTELPVAQYAMTSAVINGKIFVIGGFNGSQNNNQIYDPATNTWSAGAPLPVAQWQMTSAAVNGKIYVIGGKNGNMNNNQIYDPLNNSWTTGA